MNKFLVGLLIIVGGGIAGWYYMNGGSIPKMAPKNVDKGMTPSVTTTQTQTDQPVGTADAGSAMSGASKGGIVSQNTVSFTDTGFSPAAITIKKGTSVTFENQSALNMWVASDVHPTHQLLPGFDQLKAVSKGGLYTYTFAKVGTWTFHNHVSPTNAGKVIVTE